ncbi:hypothetical protein [Terasakiella sp. A23]|uniref:hypothetical protein n=1 Tax=Terasakiella sp. FCG-A23 TaxID=3080561 RepID=UPI002952B986|nr:hypothetical protein [Terasakiella sp. A23]
MEARIGSLMAHPLYAKQQDPAMIKHVQEEWKRALPGDVQHDETGKMIQPKSVIRPQDVRPFDPDGELQAQTTSSNEEYSGEDRFSYTVSDGEEKTALALSYKNQQKEQIASDLVSQMENGQFKIPENPNSEWVKFGVKGPAMKRDTLDLMNRTLQAKSSDFANLRAEINQRVDQGSLSKKQGGALMNVLGEKEEYGNFLDPKGAAENNREFAERLLVDMDEGAARKFNNAIEIGENLSPFGLAKGKVRGEQISAEIQSKLKPKKIMVYMSGTGRVKHSEPSAGGIDMKALGIGRNVKGRLPAWDEPNAKWANKDNSLEGMDLPNPHYDRPSHLEGDTQPLRAARGVWNKKQTEFQFREAHRMLEPGGILTVVGNASNPFVNKLSRKELQAMGFEVLEFKSKKIPSRFDLYDMYQSDGKTRIENPYVHILRKVK